MQNAEITYQLHALDRVQIERSIRAFREARLDNSERAVRTYFAEDVEFRLLGGPAAMPAPRIFNGSEAVIAEMRKFDTNIEVLGFEILDLIIDGNHAALRWYAGLRNRGTGVTGDLAVLDHIIFRNGLVSGYFQYLDSQGLETLLAGDPQPHFARLSNRKSIQRKIVPDHDEGRAVTVDLQARNAREQYLRDFWAKRILTGSAACRSHCTPDVELHLIGDPVSIPFARAHFGMEATCALIDQIDMEFEIIDFHVATVLIDGDKAALQWSASVRHRGTNAPGHIEGFDQILFENNRIKSMTEFYDTAQVARCILG